MKFSSASFLEFALTTAVLSGWVIACTAAFQATRVDTAPVPAQPPAAAVQSAQGTVGEPGAGPAAPGPRTLEAALEPQGRPQI